MTRPRLIDRVIREICLADYRRVQDEARSRNITFTQYVERRCDELRDESARRMLAQKRFELGR